VWRLRELFNKGQYVERAAHREVIAIPEKPRIYRYATLEGGTVAIVFRIRRRDSRGYSDDPKWLRIGDEAFIPGHDDFTTCAECRARGRRPYY
jgi:hypothetical protein